MADEPTLPNLPLAVNYEPFPDSPRPQKRVRLHSTSPPISSDPPFFSSDDDPSAENYTGANGRLKRKFRGPWYSQKPEDSNERKARGTLQRQFDSAVWLGSDSTEEDDDAEFSTHIPPLDALNQQKRVLPLIGGINGRAADTPRVPTPEELADKEICACLEAGKEDIDLSSRGLTHLSNAIIKPLSTLVYIPKSSQGSLYHPLRPQLKLYLSTNMLRRVPGELFYLDNITVLTLWGNNLVDLPSAIGKLHRLVELNIANNNLHFLPYEIKEIFSEPTKLHSLIWHPNPFYEPDSADYSPYKRDEPYPPDLRDGVLSQSGRPGAVSPGLPLPTPKWNVKYKFRSQVRFMNIDGTLAKGPNFPRDESLFSSSPRQRNSLTYSHHFGRSNLIPIAPPDDVPEPPKTSSFLRGGRASKAPSLLEVALQTWTQSSQLPDLHDWLGHEPPERLVRILEDAKILKETEANFRKCTICQRRFVIPRTEWLEWWQISKAQKNEQLASAAGPLKLMENRRDQVESMVPLIRRGCSWRCVPEKAPLNDCQEKDDTSCPKAGFSSFARMSCFLNDY